MKSVEELSEIIRKIYIQTHSKKQINNIATESNLDRSIVSDIKNIDDIDNIEESIMEFKRILDNGESIRKYALEYGFKDNLINYLISSLTEQKYKTPKLNKEQRYVIKVESMWRKLKSGIDVRKVAAEYEMTTEMAEQIISEFDKSIKRKRMHYSKRANISDKQIEYLKKNTMFSQDVIDYIVLGKEIDFKNSVLEDEERDE